MTDLVKALDEAVAKLLSQAGLSETAPEKIEATPAERVKAFDSALEYAKIRPTLIPKEDKESAFDRIQRDFNGGADPQAKRRGRPPKAASEGDSNLIPAAVNGGDAPRDLFDA